MPGHVVPLYAVWKPASLTVRHVAPVCVCAAFLLAFRRIRPRLWLTLTVLAVTSFLLSFTVASMNGGISAIAAPFERYGLEYYGDVPFVKNPADFLRNFSIIRPELSMHGRTHPPGPLLLIWTFWMLTGMNVTAVATCVVALAACAVIPLYLFVRGIADRDTAFTCASIYIFVPTVVLYNATSMNGVYAMFALTTIWMFRKAMEEHPVRYAVLFGISFALTFFMSYDMANLGMFFVFVFVSSMFDAERRRHVITATSISASTFLSFYLILYLATGFNVIAALQDAVVQVRQDLVFMETYTPRAPYWIWRFANPVEVFFYAGIPVTVLFCAAWISRLRRRACKSRQDIYLLAGLVMMIVFNFTYLGKSEMARVSGYYFPFIIAPAAIYLHGISEQTGSYRVVYITAGLLLAQTWLMETLLYMYW